jgi:hypothetical protein
VLLVKRRSWIDMKEDPPNWERVLSV